MKETRTSILFSGSAYNIRFSIQSIMENLIIPNNADVFIVTERRCLRRKTVAGEIPPLEDWPKWQKKNETVIQDSSQPLTDEEIQFIKDTFGDRLKVFFLVDDNIDYKNYIINERDKMRIACNEYRRQSLELGIKPPFVEIFDSDNGNIKSVIDQYHHVKKAYDLMCEYENQNNFKYDYVMRARIDFIVPEKISLEYFILPHDKTYLYVMGSFMREPFPFSDEFCWFSRRSICDQLYPQLERLGLIIDRKYDTYYPPSNNDFRFCAETQFEMLLRELNLLYFNVRIFRSATFTAYSDGYDYMNYIFRSDEHDIIKEYYLACKCESDINEHLPTLKTYAEKCSHITEFGTRYGNSTIAFMASFPKKFISYDVTYNDRIEYLERLAKYCKINFEFRLENVEQIEIEETDLLFIDTNHHARQCANELKLHADKVKKYIAFHDVETFGYGETGGQGGEQGLWLAITPFLESHPEWKILEHYKNNNGLLIIGRE